MENKGIEVKDKQLGTAQHKAQLVRQGEMHRAGVLYAKAQLLHEAQPQAFYHHAVDHASHAVRERVESIISPSGFSVGGMMPYMMPVLRMLHGAHLGKKSKIALGVTAVLGGAGAYYLQKRSRDTAH